MPGAPCAWLRDEAAARVGPRRSSAGRTRGAGRRASRDSRSSRARPRPPGPSPASAGSCVAQVVAAPRLGTPSHRRRREARAVVLERVVEVGARRQARAKPAKAASKRAQVPLEGSRPRTGRGRCPRPPGAARFTFWIGPCDRRRRRVAPRRAPVERPSAPRGCEPTRRRRPPTARERPAERPAALRPSSAASSSTARRVRVAPRPPNGQPVPVVSRRRAERLPSPIVWRALHEAWRQERICGPPSPSPRRSGRSRRRRSRRRAKLLELPREVRLVDGAAQPPPARPRARLARRLRPRGLGAGAAPARRSSPRRGGPEPRPRAATRTAAAPSRYGVLRPGAGRSRRAARAAGATTSAASRPRSRR